MLPTCLPAAVPGLRRWQATYLPAACLSLSLTSGTGEGHRSSALPAAAQSQEARTMYSEFIQARVMWFTSVWDSVKSGTTASVVPSLLMLRTFNQRQAIQISRREDGKPDSMEQRNGGGGERTFTCSWRNLTYSMISSSMDALSVCTG